MKIVTWILGFTKLGKIFVPVQKFLDGKKVHLAGAALAVPALISILQKIGEQGMDALPHIVNSDHWETLMLGVGMIAGRAAVKKVKNKVDKVDEKVEEAK